MPPPHRTHIDREPRGAGAASPPPVVPLLAATGPSTSPTSHRHLSPLRKPLAPVAVPGVTPFEMSAQMARPLSPAPLGLQPGQAEGGGLAPASSGDLLRQRSLADKESRRKAAADAAVTRMKNMEAQSLSGLDHFGLTRGCSSKGVGMAAKKAPANGQGMARQSVP